MGTEQHVKWKVYVFIIFMRTVSQNIIPVVAAIGGQRKSMVDKMKIEPPMILSMENTTSSKMTATKIMMILS